MELMKDTAEYFKVSLTAAAIRCVEIGDTSIAVILSQNGYVCGSRINSAFTFQFVPRGF